MIIKSRSNPYGRWAVGHAFYCLKFEKDVCLNGVITQQDAGIPWIDKKNKKKKN